MKKKIILSFLSLVLISLLFQSCKKCKECYIVEEVDGSKTETSIGTFCGDEITHKENEELYPPTGTAYYICK